MTVHHVSMLRRLLFATDVDFLSLSFRFRVPQEDRRLRSA